MDQQTHPRLSLTSAQRRAQARQKLAEIPWPTEDERIRDQVRRDSQLSSEERFQRQLDLLDLVGVTPEAKRWHDEQDEIEKQRFMEVFKRYEQRCGPAEQPS